MDVPDLPSGQLCGLRAAWLTPFGAVQASIGKPGSGFIPVTFSEPGQEPGTDTDLALVRQEWATVTALHLRST